MILLFTFAPSLRRLPLSVHLWSFSSLSTVAPATVAPAPPSLLLSVCFSPIQGIEEESYFFASSSISLSLLFNNGVQIFLFIVRSLRASDKCQREKRKSVNGDDLSWAMATLRFEDYIDPLKIYLFRYREGRTSNWAAASTPVAPLDTPLDSVSFPPPLPDYVAPSETRVKTLSNDSCFLHWLIR